MNIEGEDLDDMLYAVYIAKLESLKGTKKPLQDFIKEMQETTRDFRKLTYRQFQLVTRAINYCAAANPIKNEPNRLLQNRLTIMLRESATEENILDLLEFYKGTIEFSPYTMQQFLLMDKLYNIIRPHKPERLIYFKTYNVPIFDKFPYLAYGAIHKVNPNSLTLSQMGRRTSKTDLEKAKAYSEELISLLEYEEYLTNGEQQ